MKAPSLGAVALLAAGCGSPDPVDSDTEPGLSFAEPGPEPFTERADSVELDSCTMTFVRFESQGGQGPWVVLSHGFVRGPEHLAEHARHLASWGLRVATPELCHASFTDADHAQNAADLVELAGHLDGGVAVFAGHSAGGLASLLAAASLPGTAFFGLDPVDNAELGAQALQAGSPPSAALVAAPASCNADGNLVAPLGAAGVPTLRLPLATHCTFEAPTDEACTLICGGEGEGQELARHLLTAWLLARTGLDEDGALPWTSGSETQQALLQAGLVVLP